MDEFGGDSYRCQRSGRNQHQADCKVEMAHISLCPVKSVRSKSYLVLMVRLEIFVAEAGALV